MWNVAFSVTDKNGKKLDAEVDVSPTEAELEAKLRAKNLDNLIYTGDVLESSILLFLQNKTSSDCFNNCFISINKLMANFV